MAGMRSMDKEDETNGIELITLPSIDLRCFAGDELLLVAQFSGHFPEATSKDIIIPKLDRECFNESAGSRKQTYSNRRVISDFSPRGLRQSTCAYLTPELHNIGATSSTPTLCFRSNGPNGRITGVATSSKSAKAVARVIVKANDATKTVAARQVSVKKEPAENLALRRTIGRESDLTSDDLENALEISGSTEEFFCTDPEDSSVGRARNSKRTRETRLSRRAANGVSAEFNLDGMDNRSLQEVGRANTGSSSRKKQRYTFEGVDVFKPAPELEGRQAKRTAESRCSLSDSESDEVEVLLKTEENRGSLLDRLEDDPSCAMRPQEAIQRGLRKRDAGDLVDRLHKMKGLWASSSRIRKIIDATGFPVGWTVQIGLRYKNGRTLFEYCDWRSPEGKLWPSFKDATAYLLSSIGHDSPSEIVALLKASRGIGCDKKIPIVKEDPPRETICSCGENLTRISSVVAQHLRDVHCHHRYKPETDGRNENVYGLCDYSKQNSGFQLDHVFGVNSILDEMLNMPWPAIEGEGTSLADPSQCKEDHRTVLNTTETLKKRLLAIKNCCRNTIKSLIEKPCSCQLTYTDDLSPENDSRENLMNLNHGTGTIGIDGSHEPFHSNISAVECCNSQMGIDALKHNCHLCGMMFSSALKLHYRLKRARPMRSFKCEVCGRLFASMSLLFGHRVKMGHPRVTKFKRDLTSLQSQVSVPSACSTNPDVKFVLNLLSDPHEDEWTTRSKKNLKELKGMPIEVEDVVEQTRFQCKICHKIFSQQCKFRRHLIVHSKHKKKGLTTHPSQECVSSQLPSRLVDSKSNLLMLGRRNMGVETGGGNTAFVLPPVAKSVFWKLLDDP